MSKKLIVFGVIVAIIFMACETEPEGPGVGPECTLCWVSNVDGAPNIWSMNLPDGTPSRITDFAEGCGKWGISVSTDGWIYFGGKENGGWEVFRIRGDGAALERLTDDAQFDGNPAISPGCGTICFATKRWFFSTYDLELALMPSGGGEIVRLTEYEGNDDSQAWSPGGESIVFVRTYYAGRLGIAMLDISNPDSVIELSAADVDAYSPRWAPDGSAIYCVLSSNGIRDIWKFPVDLESPVNITQTDYGIENPAISPDGSLIAYQAFMDNQWDIAIIGSDGSGARMLTIDPGEDISPCWSPDGSWIFWVSYRDGDREIYGVPTDGSGLPHRMTDFVGDDIRPFCM